MSVTGDSAAQINQINTAITQVSVASKVDARLILAVIMQEVSFTRVQDCLSRPCI